MNLFYCTPATILDKDICIEKLESCMADMSFEAFNEDLNLKLVLSALISASW